MICGQPLTKPIVKTPKGRAHFACADQPAPKPAAKKSRIRRAKPKPFVPTADWQAVPPDTVLPPGLEIELDLSTGRQRARLRKA